MAEDNTTNPHLQAGPPLWFGAAPALARAAVILLHGRGGSPEEMDDGVVRPLDLPDLAYVAPRAAGGSWYPAKFMAPLEENHPHLGFALDRIAALSDELAEGGFPRPAQAIVGFSQGACLACEYVYRRGQRYGALVALTGGLIGPPGTSWTGGAADVFAGMPVVIGGGSDDPWVPAERMLETAEVWRRLGARVDATIYPGMPHVVGDVQFARARAALQALPSVLPAGRS